MNETEVDSRSI